jgi:RNA polymerase sigma factor (sigma-70 family)
MGSDKLAGGMGGGTTLVDPLDTEIGEIDLRAPAVPFEPLVRVDAPTQRPFDEVLAAAQQGEHWAMEVLYTRFHPAVLAFCMARVPGDGEDLASEVFVAVAESLRRFEGDEPSFRSWLFTIAYRTVRASWRSAGRRGPAVVLEDADLMPGGDCEDDALTRLGTREALDLIRRLPEAQAEVLALRLLADLPAEEVATIVGRRPGAVRALQLRGLRRLAREISLQNP